MIGKIYNALFVNRTKTMMKLLNLNIKFYQSLEELGLKGKRNTIKRFEKYDMKKILKPNHAVLDIGCNTGFFSMSVARYVKEVDAIDNKKINIIQGRLAKKQLNIKNLNLIRGRFETYKTTKKYDVILSFAVHHWVKMSLDDYIKKIKGLLKQKGILVFESHNLSNMDLHFDRKIEIIKEQGFKVIKKIPMKEDGNRICIILEKK